MNLTSDPSSLPPEEIKPIQLFLASHAFYPRALGIDGNFGAGSERARRGYLAASCGVDGMVDLAGVAETQIGVEEVPRGSNQGAFVNLYQDDNLGCHGESWCADFVCWCLRRLIHENSPVRAIKPPSTRAAWGFAEWAATVPGVKVLSPSKVKPQRNDIVEYVFSHVGIVQDFSNGVVHAIEGNTNLDGSREGYGVFLHPRYPSTVRAIIRVPEAN